jgi:hypothetical protein
MSSRELDKLDRRKRARKEEAGRSSGQRPRPAFIAELLAHPVYSLASRINAVYFEAVARRRAGSIRAIGRDADPGISLIFF